jgi:hypothetical protein
LRPIAGSTLLLGRQVVFMTPDQAQALVEEAGITILAGATIAYDKNEFGRAQHFISDASFFSLFSDSEVMACDVSDAEQPDLVFDLSATLPPGLSGRFDFIYNGSVLDNVFDPAACIRNVTRMLTGDGVVMHYEGAAHASPAYLKFTPDWFFDYYALNGFADCQTYVCTFDDVHQSAWKVMGWDAFYDDRGTWRLTDPVRTTSDAMVLAIAEKAPEASAGRTPIQGLYRADHAAYLPAFERYRRSTRRWPNIAGAGSPENLLNPGYRHLGLIGEQRVA